MDVRVVFLSLMLVGVLHVARLRSIDQIIEDVETDFEVWYDYKMKGRTEELVKVQLDMIITRDLWDTVIDTEDALPSRAKRNAVKDKTWLWPRRIPYILNDEFDINDKFKLVMAMDHWEEHTCLEFVEANETTDFDIIEFVPDPYRCESLLGKVQGRQPINLATPCMEKQVIVHEIGHALGLYHEHMRADRDEYVTVNYKNINKTYHPQFEKLKICEYDSYNKPYDYESIMHYGKLFFSLNRTANLTTIEPKDEAYLDVIGEALSLSFHDVKIVNEMYECSAGCEHKVCPGNGFLGKNCECYCTGKDAYQIVLCNRIEKCVKPNISLSQYYVYTKFGNEITSWEEEAVVYPHGTHFVMLHKNESCGYRTATFNCSHGQWEGQVLPCEKACLVGNFSGDYIVKSDNEIVEPGIEVLSGEGVYVSCSNRRMDTFNPEDYIDCSDGIWLRNISDIICIKENCGKPNISLSQYFVYTNDWEPAITSWEEEAQFYSHGTHLIMKHKNESCGYKTSTLNCSHGQWEGEVLPCEMACLVWNFSGDYLVYDCSNAILDPGDEVLSGEAVYVSCSNRRKDTVNPREYIECSDGVWLRNISDVICFKACLLGNFSRDYIVNNIDNQIVDPGDEVPSGEGVYVSCSNRRKDTVNPGEYIECSDGVWLRNISDMICIKEHPLCPMVVNSQLTGSFDDGFNVTCLEGYEMEAEGEPVSSFWCNWEGEWEPFTPLCNQYETNTEFFDNVTDNTTTQTPVVTSTARQTTTTMTRLVIPILVLVLQSYLRTFGQVLLLILHY